MMTKFNRILLKIFLIQILIATSIEYTNGIYIYVPDKSIKEELPISTELANLRTELLSKTQDFSNEQFTLLEDSKLSKGNVYFKLDSNNGKLTTNQFIDRESMCLNRLCADPCETSQSHSHNREIFNGSCRINLKVLMLPSSNILNINVFIEDINDNRPLFRSQSIKKEINENVPIGYKIPIDLAYDPDIGQNKIQYYEIISEEQEVRDAFQLSQNLNEAQLHLVVIGKLDREKISSYDFKIAVYDGGKPMLKNDIDLEIQIIDINDNNPIFTKKIHNFTVKEDLPVDSKIGQIKAEDLDIGLNGLIKYKFIEKSVLKKSEHSRYLQYFNLEESTGVIYLVKPLDYEMDSEFTLTVEARDSGAGSLPTLATVKINIVDINDNKPEISVSFLNMLHKNTSDGVKYDLYLPENTKSNKFLAHVNINDRDSYLNGKIDWKISLNDIEFSNSSSKIGRDFNTMLKLVRLTPNSFTINVGNSLLLDKEKTQKYNVSIAAWDYGRSQNEITYFNFSIILLDENDNAPKFEKKHYEISIYENQPKHMILFKIKANDADSSKENSNLTYSIREESVKKYLDIDKYGVIQSEQSFNRENLQKLIFHVVVSDQGKPKSLKSTARVVLTILDRNDNAPRIYYNTSFYHSIEKKVLRIQLGRNLALNTKIIDFNAHDDDIKENARVAFQISGYNKLPFRLNQDGNMFLVSDLGLYKITDKFRFRIVCRDFGKLKSLNSTLDVQIELTDVSEFCIETFNDEATRFINRDLLLANERQTTSRNILFLPEFILKPDENKNNLKFELINYKDLVDVRLSQECFKDNNENNVISRKLSCLEISLKPALNITKLIIGKYKIQVKLMNKLRPSCGKIEYFTLLIGNNFMNEKEILTYIDRTESAEYEENKNDESYKSITKIYKVKQATLLIKSDYILLVILMVIILITVIFITFICIICFCNKMKSRYSQSKKSSNKKNIYTLNRNSEDDRGSEDIEIVRTNTKTSYLQKKIRMKKVDLNSSSTSSGSSGSSSGKPQYLLVNNSSSSSSTSSNANGTLIYRDPDFDEFGLNPSSIQLVRQFNTTDNRNHKFKLPPSYQKQQKNGSRQGYVYSSTIGGKIDLNILNVYDSSNDRSTNSATNSIVESTTVDDSKSSSLNNDFEIMPLPINNNNVKPHHSIIKNSNKFQSYRNNNENSTSAYSSISDNASCLDNELLNKKRFIDSRNIACQEPDSPGSYKKSLDSNNFLTFNRAGVNVKTSNDNTIHAANITNINRHSNNSNNKNINNNYSNYGIRSKTRTSFNL